jgi:alpha-L-fucosidase
MIKSTITLLAIFLSFSLFAQHYDTTWASLDSRPVPQWYRDVKFGIFIHWGVYSVPGFRTKGQYAEWYQNGLNTGDTATIEYHKKKFGDRTYYSLADDFKAELFNPDEWAKIIEASGARYVVLTSKHHDGFALWPSKDASRDWGFAWNAAERGPHRDLLGDLFTAIRKTSVHPGLYYSLYEWYNPLWLKNRPQYISQHMWPQMKDVINTYKPEVFWTDGEWDETAETWKSKQFLAWMYNESPVKDKVVTYDRWGMGVRFKHGGVFTPEYQPDVNFDDHPWEESRGMGYSYGYNRNEDSWDYNSAQSLVLQLVDKVSGGGNFLLDIGPDGHGKIPPIMEERLLQIGDWMKLNNESIYNTVRWRSSSQWSSGRRDYKPKTGGGDLLLKLTVDPDSGYAVKECFFTYNPTSNNLYAILPKWPGDGFLIHDLVLPMGTKVELLETHDVLQWEQRGADLMVKFPAFDPNHIKGQYAYVIKINGVGAFAANPKVSTDYVGSSLSPTVTITGKDNSNFRYTLDGSVPNEQSALYVKPFMVKSSSTLKVRSFKEGKLPGDIISNPVNVYTLLPSSNSASLPSGLKLAAYELKPRFVADLDNAVPVSSKTVEDISIKDLPRADYSGMLYKGFIKIPANGLYTFYLSADDGAVLWIDGNPVVDNDGTHATEEKEGKIGLKKGNHVFKLAYIQDISDKSLKVEYSVNSGEKKLVPSTWWAH